MERTWDYLRIATSHTDVLTVDKRAMYIMAVEVAGAIDGKISSDGKQTWIDVETFKELHKDILSLTYDQATEISVEGTEKFETCRRSFVG